MVRTGWTRLKEILYLERRQKQISDSPSASPQVYDISPDTGSTAGGYPVTITGRNFHNVSDVKFGALATTYLVDSDNQITVTAPASTAGVVDVTVDSVVVGTFTYA